MDIVEEDEVVGLGSLAESDAEYWDERLSLDLSEYVGLRYSRLGESSG